MNITEQQVVEFLAAALANAKLPEGIQASISFGPYTKGSCSFFGSVKDCAGNYKWIDGIGSTLVEARANFIAKIPKTGAERAHQLRNEAQALLAQAIELEQQAEGQQ